MVYRPPEGFFVGVSGHCPKAGYDGAAIHGAPAAHYLGQPAAKSATVIQSSVAVNSTAGTLTALTTPWTADSTYGRNLRCTPSGVPGNTNVVILRGRDYRGQPMGESFTGSAAATTVIVGLKAFFYVDAIYIVTAASNAITYSIGTGDALGLPFKGPIVWWKENQIQVALALANHVTPVLTDPATVATGDPRGTVLPTNIPTGSLAYHAGITGDPSVNAAGNGGLYGISQVVI